MINRNEFFRRFDEVNPGDTVNDCSLPSIEVELYFEKLSMAGLEEMHRYSKDSRLYEYFEFEPFREIEETKAYIQKLFKRMGSDPLNRDSMYWFVRRKSDNYLIGSAGLVDLNYARRSIAWGYGVDPVLWGRGYILQIQEILKQYVFEVLELNRLHGMTMVTNQRTISSVLSAGMRHEGVAKEYYLKNGTFTDAWLYAMLSKEYFDLNKSFPASDNKFTIEDVILIVQSVLTRDQITENSTMEEVSSWDSLSHIDIIVSITEKFGIKLSPSEIMRVNSVKSLYEILLKKSI